MRDSREGSLARAVLDVVLRRLAAGDVDRLAAMGLRPEDVEGLRSLPEAALDRLAELCGRGIRVTLDGDLLRRSVAALHASRLGETLQRDLIRAGASRAMMRELFGMGDRDFRNMRAALGVTTGIGRPRALDEASEVALWSAVAARCGPGAKLGAGTYLALQRETGLPVRAIWRFVQGLSARPGDGGA